MIKKKHKVICIICARGGSKGLINKNLKKILNKPLIYYPINAAIKSRVINKIIVSTDSKKIAKISKYYGAEVPFLRPKKISGDFATTEETLKHALLETEKIFKVKFDICVFLTCTDIFRKVSWIRRAVNLLKKNKKLDSVFAGSITHKNFWELNNNKWKRIKSWMKIYSSRQVRKKIVREDTGIACATRSKFWRKGRRLGNNVDIIVNNSTFTGIDIHNILDLKLARYAIKLWKI
jgi:CMP-N,N'-diacetyllegionaminic acid synthase